MKNPFSFILIAAALFLLFSGEFGFFIPALILFFVINSVQSKKKNQQRRPPGRGRGYDPYQRRRQRDTRPQYEQQRRRPTTPPRPRQKPKPRPKPNPQKNSGVTKYKDYDYEGAIEDFKKALKIESNDIPTHFNIACAYSLTEEKDLAYQHIDYAVQLGFKDFEKIKTHDVSFNKIFYKN